MHCVCGVWWRARSVLHSSELTFRSVMSCFFSHTHTHTCTLSLSGCWSWWVRAWMKDNLAPGWCRRAWPHSKVVDAHGLMLRAGHLHFLLISIWVLVYGLHWGVQCAFFLIVGLVHGLVHVADSFHPCSKGASVSRGASVSMEPYDACGPAAPPKHDVGWRASDWPCCRIVHQQTVVPCFK